MDMVITSFNNKSTYSTINWIDYSMRLKHNLPKKKTYIHAEDSVTHKNIKHLGYII